MPAIVRKNDNCSGHDLCPPRPSATASPDVFCNGQPVVRYGDTMELHGCPVHPPHSGTHDGQHTVFVNGRSIQAVGDPISCGSVCAEGSPDVFVED